MNATTPVIEGDPALKDAPNQRLRLFGAGSEPAAAVERAVLSCHGLRMSYKKGAVEVPVLRGVDLAISPGEFHVIVGQSGSGKSTLLHLLGTLDVPDEGEIYFEGNRIDRLPAHGRDILRNRHLGMVFQSYHLLPELTARENVLAAAMIRYGVLAYWRKRRALVRQADEMLDLVGLGHRALHRPRELSGGEMQRVAIARALLPQPSLLLADEPTGNLDNETSEQIVALLRRLNRQQGLTIVMVTHDESLAATADRTTRLVDGLACER